MTNTFKVKNPETKQVETYGSVPVCYCPVSRTWFKISETRMKHVQESWGCSSRHLTKPSIIKTENEMIVGIFYPTNPTTGKVEKYGFMNCDSNEVPVTPTRWQEIVETWGCVQ